MVGSYPNSFCTAEHRLSAYAQDLIYSLIQKSLKFSEF
jgi:hypothetical protein